MSGPEYTTNTVEMAKTPRACPRPPPPSTSNPCVDNPFVATTRTRAVTPETMAVMRSILALKFPRVCSTECPLQDIASALAKMGVGLGVWQVFNSFVAMLCHTRSVGGVYDYRRIMQLWLYSSAIHGTVYDNTLVPLVVPGGVFSRDVFKELGHMSAKQITGMLACVAPSTHVVYPLTMNLSAPDDVMRIIADSRGGALLAGRCLLPAAVYAIKDVPGLCIDVYCLDVNRRERVWHDLREALARAGYHCDYWGENIVRATAQRRPVGAMITHCDGRPGDARPTINLIRSHARTTGALFRSFECDVEKIAYDGKCIHATALAIESSRSMQINRTPSRNQSKEGMATGQMDMTTASTLHDMGLTLDSDTVAQMTHCMTLYMDRGDMHGGPECDAHVRYNRSMAMPAIQENESTPTSRSASSRTGAHAHASISHARMESFIKPCILNWCSYGMYMRSCTPNWGGVSTHGGVNRASATIHNRMGLYLDGGVPHDTDTNDKVYGREFNYTYIPKSGATALDGMVSRFSLELVSRLMWVGRDPDTPSFVTDKTFAHKFSPLPIRVRVVLGDTAFLIDGRWEGDSKKHRLALVRRNTKFSFLVVPHVEVVGDTYTVVFRATCAYVTTTNLL